MNKENGRFEKGDIPANKGVARKFWMSESSQKKCERTQFKKGHAPINGKEIGSERITKDGGYVEVKVAEPNKWERKHRLIYQEHYEEIPKGSIIIFLDGNKRNFDINNLACVTREELAYLNKRGLLKKDIELSKSGIAIARLLSKVYRKGRIND